MGVNAAGDVTIEQGEEGEGHPAGAPEPTRPATPPGIRGSGRHYAVSLEGFEEGVVGRKSLNLKRLGDGLPSWISVPRSVAVPFGVFERVRQAAPNQVAETV